MQKRVATAAGRWIVERLAKIVPPEKPLEAPARRLAPELIASHRERFETGGDHGVGFQGLLIEARPLAAARPKAVAADRREVAGFRGLRIEQPA